MFSSKTITYIKEILMRLSSGEPVTLEERIYIQKAANEDQKVSSWLKRARRLQGGEEPKSSVDKLINEARKQASIIAQALHKVGECKLYELINRILKVPDLTRIPAVMDFLEKKGEMLYEIPMLNILMLLKEKILATFPKI